MREFANESSLKRIERLRSELALAVVAGLILTILGPFQTSETDFLARIGFWMALSATWFVIVALVESWLDTIPTVRNLSPTYRLALVVAVTAAPMLIPVIPALHALGKEPLDPLCIPHLYSKVLLIGGGLSMLSLALFSEDGEAFRVGFQKSAAGEPRREPTAALEIPHSPEDPCPLRSKLPLGMGETIQCLEMEDHYVRVHDAVGSALILMRLTDAIDALGEEAGLRVHRSWWVARDAVTGVVREGRGLRLQLANGRQVPVSQSYRQDVIATFGAPA